VARGRPLAWSWVGKLGAAAAPATRALPSHPRGRRANPALAPPHRRPPCLRPPWPGAGPGRPAQLRGAWRWPTQSLPNARCVGRWPCQTAAAACRAPPATWDATISTTPPASRRVHAVACLRACARAGFARRRPLKREPDPRCRGRHGRSFSLAPVTKAPRSAPIDIPSGVTPVAIVAPQVVACSQLTALHPTPPTIQPAHRAEIRLTPSP
jgi:hypothetical protein